MTMLNCYLVKLFGFNWSMILNLLRLSEALKFNFACLICIKIIESSEIQKIIQSSNWSSRTIQEWNFWKVFYVENVFCIYTDLHKWYFLPSHVTAGAILFSFFIMENVLHSLWTVPKMRLNLGRISPAWSSCFCIN